MYYLQSRYYDASVCRFVNGDIIESISLSLTDSMNLTLYTYCLNNPIIFYDCMGFAVETAFDAVSAIWSLVDLIVAPSWLNFGFFIWDIASILVPYLPGSYAAKGGKIILKVASKIDDFAAGTKFLTGTYKKLKKLYKYVKGIEIHHLVEKRFKILFKYTNVDDYLSIPLTKDLHRIITNRWRDLYKKSNTFKFFKYGSNYSKITYDMMEKAIKEVYRDMPQLLEETLAWFRKNWRK